MVTVGIIVGVAVIALVGGFIIGMKTTSKALTFQVEQMEQQYARGYAELQMKYDEVVGAQKTSKPTNPIGFRVSKVS